MRRLSSALGATNPTRSPLESESAVPVRCGARLVASQAGCLVENHDGLIAFSTCGKNREVLDLFELARRLGFATIAGVTSHPDPWRQDGCDASDQRRCRTRVV
jgi:fructoselysine-6-P-deglycase FrlB-like protein